MVGSTAEECNFAIVQQVTISAIDDRNVTFTTRGAGDGSADQNLRKTFTVPLSEVYAVVIDGAPPPVAMVVGATGNLYLSREGWQAMSDDGQCQIFGAARAIFKFPRCGAIATPPLTRLTVIPTSIIVRGHRPGKPRDRIRRSPYPFPNHLLRHRSKHSGACSQIRSIKGRTLLNRLFSFTSLLENFLCKMT